MGGTLSAFGGRKKVQNIIAKAGLPLEISDSDSGAEQAPLSPFTEAYPAAGWFTGVKSTVTVPAPADVVYDSLSKDLHHVFTPMTVSLQALLLHATRSKIPLSQKIVMPNRICAVLASEWYSPGSQPPCQSSSHIWDVCYKRECDDEIEEDHGKGSQVIFRIVRIPFQVAFVSGNLKLRLHVEQNRKTRKIRFESLKEGRLIERFIATFDFVPKEGDEENHTAVTLDAKISAKQLPPPPFKGMVKDVMVRKMDACMVDLVNFHSKGPQEAEGPQEGEPASRQPSAASLGSPATTLQSRGSGFLNGWLSRSRKSFELGKSLDRRRSQDRRRSLDFRKSLDRRKSVEVRH